MAVFPSADDDVITSPYNRLETFKYSLNTQLVYVYFIMKLSSSVLALHELTEKADCVLPIDNQVL